MTTETPSSLRDLRAALDWWRAAGVDCDFADEPRDWLEKVDSPDVSQQEEAREQSPAATADPPSANSVQTTPEKIDLLGNSPPRSLEDFQKFWLEAPGLDDIGPRGRIAPRGTAHPQLMILVVDPEDSDADRLLSGRQGKLLNNILAAMGVDENAAYIASALPRHTPMADTVAAARRGMDRVTLHHISLVAPERLITFGSGILPLIGHDPTKEISSLREINHGSATVPLLASEGLDSLMSMARLKARFWRRWIEWSDGI